MKGGSRWSLRPSLVPHGWEETFGRSSPAPLLGASPGSHAQLFLCTARVTCRSASSLGGWDGVRPGAGRRQLDSRPPLQPPSPSLQSSGPHEGTL